MRQIKRRAKKTVNMRDREKTRLREKMKEGEGGSAITEERREDFARDRGRWRREKEIYCKMILTKIEEVRDIELQEVNSRERWRGLEREVAAVELGRRSL